MASRLLHSLHDGFLFHVIRLCRIRAASEKIARGFALGIVPHFFPTFGLGALVSAFIARVCGGNGMAGLVSGALLTPFWPFFFYMNVNVGSWLLHTTVQADEASALTTQAAGALVVTRNFSVGGIINAALIALTAYLVLLAIYERIRPKLLSRLRQRARWRSRTRQLVPA